MWSYVFRSVESRRRLLWVVKLQWIGVEPIGRMLQWTQVRWIGEFRGAAADARQIVAWRAAGYSVTRRNCESYGMSRRRWVWAVGLLKLARVLGDQVASADTFLIEDVEECAEAIRRCRGSRWNVVVWVSSQMMTEVSMWFI